MIFTTHIIVGSAAGSLTGNPGLAFLYGLISHHIIDVIPHIDPGSYIKEKFWKYPKVLVAIGIDLLVGLIIFIWLWKQREFSPVIFWGALGGVVSDIVDNGPWQEVVRKLPVFKQFHAMHHYLHATVPPPRRFGRGSDSIVGKWGWLLGMLTQLALIAASVGIIMR